MVHRRYLLAGPVWPLANARHPARPFAPSQAPSRPHPPPPRVLHQVRFRLEEAAPLSPRKRKKKEKKKKKQKKKKKKESSIRHLVAFSPDCRIFVNFSLLDGIAPWLSWSRPRLQLLSPIRMLTGFFPWRNAGKPRRGRHVSFLVVQSWCRQPPANLMGCCRSGPFSPGPTEKVIAPAARKLVPHRACAQGGAGDPLRRGRRTAGNYLTTCKKRKSPPSRRNNRLPSRFRAPAAPRRRRPRKRHARPGLTATPVTQPEKAVRVSVEDRSCSRPRPRPFFFFRFAADGIAFVRPTGLHALFASA